MDNLNQSGERQVEIDETNPISLLNNPEKFKDTFYEMTSIASEGLKAQEYDKALKALNKCLDMLDLGKNILKDASKYWKLCIYGNLACAYQGTWKMQKCNKFCEKIEEELERLLQSADCKQVYLNITKYLIRIKFQHCAILSQLSQHDRALEMCQSTLPTLQKYMESILQYTQSLKANRSEKKSSETVHFSKHVCAFAQQILNNLVTCLKQPLRLNIDKSSFYYWQKNPENNEKQVEKKFVSPRSNDSCKRSILGVNKIAHWIDEFNIGTIMHMSEMTISDFEQTIPIEQYLFKDKLYEAVIHCSIAHFTIATEMRFIEANKQKQKKKQDQSSVISTNIQSINKKYGYEEKSELFQVSELYHLRAINIMAQNIKTTVPYISHLIKSYDKHYIYKKQLDPVIAIAEEESLMSISDTNQMSLNKRDFVQNSSNHSQQKGNSRMMMQENEGEHYFTNMNPNMIMHQGEYGSGIIEREHQQKMHTENDNILDQLEENFPQTTRQKHQKRAKNQKKHSLIKNEKQYSRGSSSSEEMNLAPNHINADPSRNQSTKRYNRNRSGLKKTKMTTTHKSVKKDDVRGLKKKEPKEKDKKKKVEQTEKQFRLKHQSSTQIKVVYKKKK